MIPSPQSQLSSFRDYYRHTSQNEDFSPEGTINLGFINFEVNKLFKRYQWKINEYQYWNLFYAFRKIQESSFGVNNRVIAKINMQRLLKKIHKKENKVTIKRKALVQILNNISEMRKKEIQFYRRVELWHLGKVMKNIEKAFFSLNNKPTMKVQKYSREQATYLLKLSHAQFSIVIRNTLSVFFIRNFEILKHAKSRKNVSQVNSSVSFFKQKKDKRSYEQKIDPYINLYTFVMKVHSLLDKKMNGLSNIFILKLKKLFAQRQKITKQSQYQGDDSQILTGAVRHMIYLTNKMMDRSKTKTSMVKEKLKALKLKYLLIKLKRKEKEIVNQYVLRWRGQVNRINELIALEICELQRMKQEYV